MVLTNLQMAQTGFFIPYYSYMNLPPRGLSSKIRVNPCESVVKSIRSLYAFCQNQSQSVLICGKSFHFVNFFMQNEPNFKKVEINTSPYMTNRYAKICSLIQPKNEAKTKPNEPNSNPIRTQIKPNQTQFSVNLGNFALRITTYSLRTYSELVEPNCYDENSVLALELTFYFLPPVGHLVNSYIFPQSFTLTPSNRL